jgi:hypothetical protein
MNMNRKNKIFIYIFFIGIVFWSLLGFYDNIFEYKKNKEFNKEDFIESINNDLARKD